MSLGCWHSSKTWEQFGNPEPLWEIYREPWNRVSGLYAAISTREPWERVIVSDKQWEMEICFYYWCCFKNLRAKDKPEKLRIRCHDLMCSVQLITRVFHLVRAICSPVVVRLLLVCIIDHLWRPRRGEAALEKGSLLFLGISSNSHWTVLTNTFAQPFSFNHLQAKLTCLEKRSKHRNSGRIPSLIGSLTPAHGRLSRNMINNFCKRIISHPVKS